MSKNNDNNKSEELYDCKLELTKAKIDKDVLSMKKDLLYVNKQLEEAKSFMRKISLTAIGCMITSLSAVFFEVWQKFLK